MTTATIRWNGWRCPFQNSSLLPFSGSGQRALGGHHLYWLYSQAIRLPELLLHLPLRETPAARVEGVPLLMDYVELVDGLEDDGFWKKIHHPTDFTGMQAAMFHLTGWYDMAGDGTIENYHEALARSQESVRRAQKLVIGPWGHGGGLSEIIEGTDFGPENSGEGQRIQQAMLAWFDHWLKGIDNGIMAEPAVRYFVLGANIWREAGQWPPAESAVTPYYLHSFGHANTLNGDGVLSPAMPGAQPADEFVYDPCDPFPSQWKDGQDRVAMADRLPPGTASAWRFPAVSTPNTTGT